MFDDLINKLCDTMTYLKVNANDALFHHGND